MNKNLILKALLSKHEGDDRILTRKGFIDNTSLTSEEKAILHEEVLALYKANGAIQVLDYILYPNMESYNGTYVISGLCVSKIIKLEL